MADDYKEISQDIKSVNDSIKDSTSKLDEYIDQVSYNEKYVSDGKALIASAITEKGVATSADDSFETMANNIKSIKSEQSEEVDILSDNLVFYVNNKYEKVVDGKLHSLKGDGKFIQFYNLDSLTTSGDYINNGGVAYGIINNNMSIMGTNCTITLKIKPNTITSWREVLAFGVNDAAISLTYGNNKNLVLFAHDDVITDYFTLTENKEYDLTVSLYIDKIKYYINGKLVGTANLDKTKSTEGLYEDKVYIFCRGENLRLSDTQMAYLAMYSKNLTDDEILSNYNILNPTPVIDPDDPDDPDDTDEFYTGYFNEPSITSFTNANAFFMSESGNDNNDGKTRNTPIKTISKYASIIAANNFTESTLYVEDGTYKVTGQVALGANKFGTTTKVNIIGIGNKADITQATRLDNSKFTTEVINGKTVYVYDFTGLTSYSLVTSGASSNIGMAPFVMVNGVRMKLAGYPKKPICCVSADKYGIGTLSNGKLVLKANDTDAAIFSKVTDWRNAVCEGNFSTSFYNQVYPVNNYTASTKSLNMAFGESGNVHSANTSYNTGVLYRLINVKSLLTEPGEYYIDFANKKFYIILPYELSKCKVDFVNGGSISGGLFNAVSSSIDGNDYSNDLNISFTKINFTGINSTCFNGYMSGMTLEKCRFSGVLGNAVYATKVKNIKVKNCRFSYVTGYNVSLVNGVWVTSEKAQRSRQNLVASNNIVEGCRFEENGNHVQLGTHNNPINSLTVGAVIRDNRIQNTLGIGINFQYNDNIIEENKIKNPGYMVGDASAIYIGRDLLAFGNIIRNNHIFGYAGPDIHNRWLMGVYLDDATSGVTVTGNTIDGPAWGIYIPGGSCNTITNNIINNCYYPIKGTDFFYRYVSSLWTASTTDGRIHARISKTNPWYRTNAIWKAKYPNVVYILDYKDPDAIPLSEIYAKPNYVKPRYNIVTGNTFTGNKQNALFEDQFKANSTISNNKVVS